ncbi:MAG: DUF2017 family protein [bacterium]
MKLTGSSGRARVRFDPAETLILGAQLDELLVSLDEMGPGDPVWERLYPAAFGDADAAEEFREMVGEDLDNARRERVGACRAELAAAAEPPTRRGRDIVLGPEELERWIMALNDLRLALGTTLGITADEDGSIDPDEPLAGQRAIYHWLTAVQDGLVSAALA